MRNAEAAIFSRRGGSKKFEDGGEGLKIFKTWGEVTDLGGLLLLGGQYPITYHGQTSKMELFEKIVSS